MVYKLGTRKASPDCHPRLLWEQRLEKSFVKQGSHLLPLQNSVWPVAGGLGGDLDRNQPLLVRKTLLHGHKNKTMLRQKTMKWGKQGALVAVNGLPSWCLGWIPARHYLFIGFTVKLRFNKRSHCMKGMSRATGYCVHSLGPALFTRACALVPPSAATLGLAELPNCLSGRDA